MEITLDDSDIKRFERDLKLFARKAFPFATKETINRAAFGTQKAARATIAKTMITRTKGKRSAAGSVLVNPTKTLRVSRQIAATGSTELFMERQEFGFTERSEGKHGVPLITAFASGEGMQTVPRRRLATRVHHVPNIQLRRQGRRRLSARQRTLVAVKQAAKSGNKFVFLNLGRKKGLFKILGTKKKPLPRMVADLSGRTHQIQPRPWLKPSFDLVARQLPRFYRDALRKQIHRHRVFSAR